jgi:hypothetical protein
MNTFFDESGGLNIDDLILQQPSFQKIMEDGIVTEEELLGQKERVVALLKKFEQNSTSEQIDQVRELLAEISVLIAVQNTHEKNHTNDD